MRHAGAAAIAFAFLMSVALAAQDRPQVAETVFKNIQVLKGIPVDDFMDTMGIMSAALGFDCSECHTGAGTDTVKWEADTDKKRTARRMTLMVGAINRTQLRRTSGRDVLDLPSRPRYSSRHAGDRHGVWRAAPRGRRHRHAVVSGRAVCRADSRQISTGAWRRRAAGGRHQLHRNGNEPGLPWIRRRRARFRSLRKRRISAPRSSSSRRVSGARTPSAPSTAAAGGCRRHWPSCPSMRLEEVSWMAPESMRSCPFPRRSRKPSRQLRVGPPDNIDGRDVHVVQGNGSRGLVATLYFDKESGLLVRMVRFGSSPIGRAPTQVDFRRLP